MVFFPEQMQNNDTTNELWSCLKRNSLMIFDTITSTDVIPLMDNVQLIRGTNSNAVDIDGMRYFSLSHHIFGLYLIMKNQTKKNEIEKQKKVFYSKDKGQSDYSKNDPVLSRIHQTPTMSYDNIDVNRTVWVNHILRRSMDILQTHDIRLNIGDTARNGNFHKNFVYRPFMTSMT